MIESENTLPKVTLGWDCRPTIELEGGYVLPRTVEMIINGKFYPDKEPGEWPCDPETGSRLDISDK